MPDLPPLPSLAALPPLPESSSNLLPDEPPVDLAPLIGQVGTTVRSGWQSSEFWLTVAGMAALTAVATVGLLVGRLSGVAFAALAIVACVVAPAVYAAERAVVKIRAIEAADG